MRSGPRPRWRRWVSLGHGGSCTLAVTVCMVRAFVLFFASDLEKSEQNPSQALLEMQSDTTYIANRNTVTLWLRRAGTHPAWESQRSAAPSPCQGAEQCLRLPQEDSWGFLSALAKLRPLCHQPLRTP